MLYLPPCYQIHYYQVILYHFQVIFSHSQVLSSIVLRTSSITPRSIIPSHSIILRLSSIITSHLSSSSIISLHHHSWVYFYNSHLPSLSGSSLSGHLALFRVMIPSCTGHLLSLLSSITSLSSITHRSSSITPQVVFHDPSMISGYHRSFFSHHSQVIFCHSWVIFHPGHLPSFPIIFIPRSSSIIVLYYFYSFVFIYFVGRNLPRVGDVVCSVVDE